jgi:hypothetical protein
VDLVGGYYDAGDHVKFGLPMAFTVTMLSWSLIEYGGDVAAAGELGHALEAVKWGTDYFIKAHTQPDELWAEVTPLLLTPTVQPAGRLSIDPSSIITWPPGHGETSSHALTWPRAEASCYTHHRQRGAS